MKRTTELYIDRETLDAWIKDRAQMPDAHVTYETTTLQGADQRDRGPEEVTGALITTEEISDDDDLP